DESAYLLCQGEKAKSCGELEPDFIAYISAIKEERLCRKATQVDCAAKEGETEKKKNKLIQTINRVATAMGSVGTKKRDTTIEFVETIHEQYRMDSSLSFFDEDPSDLASIY